MSTRKPPLARRFIAALLMVLLTACHSWRPTTVSPQRLIAEDQPSSVRVTLIEYGFPPRMDDETVTIDDPTMRNDSIVGDTGLGVASRDIRSLEVRRFSVRKTVGLVLAAYVAFVRIVLIGTCGGGCR